MKWFRMWFLVARKPLKRGSILMFDQDFFVEVRLPCAPLVCACPSGHFQLVVSGVARDSVRLLNQHDTIGLTLGRGHKHWPNFDTILGQWHAISCVY